VHCFRFRMIRWHLWILKKSPQSHRRNSDSPPSWKRRCSEPIGALLRQRPMNPEYNRLRFADYYAQYSIESRPPASHSDPDCCQAVHYAIKRKNACLCLLMPVPPREHRKFSL
jgi:hypothetical protein